MSLFFRQFPKVKYDFSGQGILTNVVDIFRYIKADSLAFDDLSTYQFYQIKDGDRPDIVSNMIYGTPDYYWTFFIVNDTLKTGLSGWPLSGEEFDRYMAEEYDGLVIETKPSVIKDSDGLVIDYRDSLVNRFKIKDEVVVGALSGATGRMFEKDVQKCQLILKGITGNFQLSESVVGQSSSDSVAAYRIWKWAEAPHHYEDAEGREIYNAIHINEQNGTGVQPGYSDPEVKIVTNLEYERQLNDEKANIRVIRPELIAEFARVYEKLITDATGS